MYRGDKKDLDFPIYLLISTFNAADLMNKI